MPSLFDEKKLLHVSGREEWRAWLMEHYRSAAEAWLVVFKKHAAKAGISYDEAVEEALCFGWIDSVMKSLDQERFAQRFSPRRPKSHYTQTNLERIRALARQGKVMPEVLAFLADLDTGSAPQENL